jgi:hypothetical protein
VSMVLYSNTVEIHGATAADVEMPENQEEKEQRSVRVIAYNDKGGGLLVMGEDPSESDQESRWIVTFHGVYKRKTPLEQHRGKQKSRENGGTGTEDTRLPSAPKATVPGKHWVLASIAHWTFACAAASWPGTEIKAQWFLFPRLIEAVRDVSLAHGRYCCCASSPAALALLSVLCSSTPYRRSCP